ncbi:MAG: DinB family protein [Chitinophagales bacterium]|nr:DinB family protein [Bacteroidota bacterium]
MNTKEEIKQALIQLFEEVNSYLKQVENQKYKQRKNGKWSIAQNIEHLSISNSITTLGLNTPKIVLKQVYKAPKRKTWNYEEVVWKYQLKLNTGAKAPLPFQPRLSNFPTRKLINSTWKKSFESLIKTIDKWKEEDLDKFCMPHPILGVLSVREMLFFTLYHNRHHFKTIQSLV